MQSSKPSSTKKHGFLQEFDIYGLGVVLVELGLWRTVGNPRESVAKRDPTWQDEKFPEYLGNRVAAEMPGMMGSRFTSAAEWCLSIRSRMSTGISEKELLTQFEEKVLVELLKCQKWPGDLHHNV